VTQVVEVIRGNGPVILGMPHTGTWVPDDVLAKLTDRGRLLADTDWHIDRLYDALIPDATIVRARFHRYVIDANRDPSGASLYPGQNTTGLVPLTDFDGEPIWESAPDEGEVAARRKAFHAPYHAALEAEMARVRAAHGVVVLYDCHSIRSRIPFLFEGRLPDFNIGTNGGTSCAPRIEAAVLETCTAARGFTTVLNGRFKGGWTTRHYGRPTEGWHAIQMELAQITHLAEERRPFRYDPAKAEPLRRVLRDALARVEEIAHSMGGQR
jgi:N-formylglutamate deformylase